MKRLFVTTAVALTVGGGAFGQQPPMPVPPGSYSMTLNEPEINTMIQLLDVACKQVGTAGGCREAIYLIDKLNEVRRPKVAQPLPAPPKVVPPVEPAKKQ